MLLIHLAQIYYNPAYFDAPLDYLAEPCFTGSEKGALGHLRGLPEIDDVLIDLKGRWLAHQTAKLIGLAEWSANQGANLLVFPEYSVPAAVLPGLRSVAREKGIAIIAGSHRVSSGDEDRLIYQGMGISPLRGTAVVPIIGADGSVQIASKAHKSKWEQNLNVEGAANDPFFLKLNAETISVAVVPCIDSLHADVLAQIFKKKPDLILCPSLSPTTEPFDIPGKLAALHELPFGYVNSAEYGGTFFHIPDQWSGLLCGLGSPSSSVPAHSEGIVEVGVDLRLFYEKRGSVIAGPVCTRPRVIPVVYCSSPADWLPGYDRLVPDVAEWLGAPDPISASEWLDSYLADNSAAMPSLVTGNLKYLRHTVLPLFDGNTREVLRLFDLARLGVDSLTVLAENVDLAIRALANCMSERTDLPAEAVAQLLASLSNLKSCQRQLPAIKVHPKPKPGDLLAEPSKTLPAQDLVEGFQNRGADFDAVKGYLQNPDDRIILVGGALGSGKTDFLSVLFKKSLTDWEPITIKVAPGSRFARVVADIGYRLNMPMDIDSLSMCSAKVFGEKVRKVMEAFYGRPKRALIIDDLHSVLKRGSGRDYRQLNTFIDEALRLELPAGGRIFLISSAFFPQEWLNRDGIVHLYLRPLHDLYTRRIIEYHMRIRGLVQEETPPQIPQDYLDLVKGHPLAARLLVQTIESKGLDQPIEDTAGLAGGIARLLLQNIELNHNEQKLLGILSIFRLPVPLPSDLFVEFGMDPSTLGVLVSRCIASFDGRTYSMHEAVRRYFYGSLPQKDLRVYHRAAAEFYRRLYAEQRGTGRPLDPSLAAEYTHHLSLSGEVAQAAKIRLLIISEVKPVARRIYQEYRDYPRALDLYRLLAEVVPDDPEVLAYLGRCYARRQQWDDSDQAFQQAIKAALYSGIPVWWIYRDWGHIRARYSFYEIAEQHLTRASQLHGDDPSIDASLAYMSWRKGDETLACEYFEKALGRDPNHAYTLAYYSKLLLQMGEEGYARRLKERLMRIEADNWASRPREYELEPEEE